MVALLVATLTDLASLKSLYVTSRTLVLTEFHAGTTIEAACGNQFIADINGFNRFHNPHV